MRFSSEFIDKVLEATDIYDLISQYTSFKKSSGHRHTGLCPFPDHNEKTPSFSVDVGKQLYYCFGCKKAGNGYNFIQDYMGLSFPEALEFLSRRAGISMPEPERKGREGGASYADRKKSLINLNRLAETFYLESFNKLEKTHPARVYAQKRGLSSEICERFKIGYAPEEWEALVGFLDTKKASLSLAAELGLVRRRSDGKSGCYDMQRGRLIFPILSTLGEPLGFGGRIIGEGEPKYLNSPESLVFKKGKLLYGLNEAVREIRSQDRIVIVEGYMDAIALHSSGIKEVGAVLGTALTEDHGRLIKRYTKNVVLLFDGDRAGLAAAEKSLPVLLTSGLFPKAVFLPDKMDPDDYLCQHGEASLREKLDRASDLFNLVVDGWMESYSGAASEKVKLVQKLTAILPMGSNKSLMGLYLEDVSQRLGVSLQWLVDAIRQNRGDEKGTGLRRAVASEEEKIEIDGSNEVERIDVSKAPVEQLKLLQLACKREELFARVEGEDILKYMSHEGVLKVFERLVDAYRQTPEKFATFGALLSSYVLDPMELLSMDKNGEEVDLGVDFQEFEGCVKRLKQKSFQEQTLQLKNMAKSQSLDDDLLEKFMKLKRSKMALDKESNKRDD